MSKQRKAIKLPDFDIPRSKDDWLHLVRDLSYDNQTIHDLEDMDSGSKVGKEQFLMFRALHRHEFHDIALDKEVLGLDKTWDRAMAIVDSNEELKKYLKVISEKKSINSLDSKDSDFPGHFNSVKRFQELMTRVPRNLERKRPEQSPLDNKKRLRRESKLDITEKTKLKKDFRFESDREVVDDPSNSSETTANLDDLLDLRSEMTPNTSLLLLLQQLSALVPARNTEWTLDPVHLSAIFEEAGFTAYTDGALRSSKDDRILALIEAKRRPRPKTTKSIIMQETAELVAWVMGVDQDLPNLNNQ